MSDCFALTDVSSLAWSRDGYFLATGGSDTKIMIWETENFSTFCPAQHRLSCICPDIVPVARQTTLKFHQGFVKGLAFDPTGELLASQVRLHDAIVDWSLVLKAYFATSPMINQSVFGRLQTGLSLLG